MFIKNLAAKPIKDISFEGYFFTIPVGVSNCWDKFGEFLFKNIYKIEGDGGGIPAVIQATAEQYKGVLHVEVKRFPINHEHIPARKDLLKIAKQRGVDAVTIEEWNEDETIENKEIVDAINNLSVPEHIAYPKVGDETAQDVELKDSADTAEDALKDDTVTDTTVKVEAPTKVPAKAPKTPSTGGKSGSGKKTDKKAAAKAPKTPTPPKK